MSALVRKCDKAVFSVCLQISTHLYKKYDTSNLKSYPCKNLNRLNTIWKHHLITGCPSKSQSNIRNMLLGALLSFCICISTTKSHSYDSNAAPLKSSPEIHCEEQYACCAWGHWSHIMGIHGPPTLSFRECLLYPDSNWKITGALPQVKKRPSWGTIITHHLIISAGVSIWDAFFGGNP